MVLLIAKHLNKMIATCLLQAKHTRTHYVLEKLEVVQIIQHVLQTTSQEVAHVLGTTSENVIGLNECKGQYSRSMKTFDCILGVALEWAGRITMVEPSCCLNKINMWIQFKGKNMGKIKTKGNC